MARTAIEIVADHVKALNARDLDPLIADYADDAVMISANGVVTGASDIRQVFGGVFAQMPTAVFEEKSVAEANGVVLMEWSMRSEAVNISHGADTFVIRDGLIVAQTASVATD